jgi:hypothetical protein
LENSLQSPSPGFAAALGAASRARGSAQRTRPVPRLKRTNGSVLSLGFQVLGDANMTWRSKSKTTNPMNRTIKALTRMEKKPGVSGR